MRRNSQQKVTAWLAGLGLLAAIGCSSTRSSQTAQNRPQTSSMMPLAPDQRSVTVPGSSLGEDRAKVHHPEHVHVAYARWQEQQKQYPEARVSYQKALDHDPKSVEALLGLSRLEQLAGRSQEAERYLLKAQKLRPQDALVRAGWGEYHSARQQWPQAIEKYREAVELAPDEPLYKHQLAVIFAKSGDWDAALAAFTLLVGTGEAHYNIAFLLREQGKLLEAEEHLQRAVAANPELDIAANMLAKVRRERGVGNVADAKPTETLSAPAPATSAVPANLGPLNRVQPASWQRTEPTETAATAPIASATPAPATSPQQEQWRNQSSIDAFTSRP